MPRYKLAIIASQATTPSKLLDVITKASQTIQSSGGVVLEVQNRGVQPLAYPFEDR
jgi:ribosomal protein S6